MGKVWENWTQEQKIEAFEKWASNPHRLIHDYLAGEISLPTGTKEEDIFESLLEVHDDDTTEMIFNLRELGRGDLEEPFKKWYVQKGVEEGWIYNLLFEDIPKEGD